MNISGVGGSKGYAPTGYQQTAYKNYGADYGRSVSRRHKPDPNAWRKHHDGDTMTKARKKLERHDLGSSKYVNRDASPEPSYSEPSHMRQRHSISVSEGSQKSLGSHSAEGTQKSLNGSPEGTKKNLNRSPGTQRSLSPQRSPTEKHLSPGKKGPRLKAAGSSVSVVTAGTFRRGHAARTIQRFFARRWPARQQEWKERSRGKLQQRLRESEEHRARWRAKLSDAQAAGNQRAVQEAQRKMLTHGKEAVRRGCPPRRARHPRA